MNSLSLNLFLQMSLISLPGAIVCLAGCVVLLGRWKSGGGWAVWALLGFGLGLVISITYPVTQALVQGWLVSSGNAPHYAWMLTGLGLFWAVMRACVYVLLFVAIFEGRK